MGNKLWATTCLTIVWEGLRHRQSGGAGEHADLQHRFGACEPAEAGNEAALERASAALALLEEQGLALQEVAARSDEGGYQQRSCPGGSRGSNSNRKQRRQQEHAEGEQRLGKEL